MVSLRYVNVRHYDPPHPPVGFFLGWANPVMKRRNHTPSAFRDLPLYKLSTGVLLLLLTLLLCRVLAIII